MTEAIDDEEVKSEYGGGNSNITDLAKQSPETYRANRQRFGLGRKK
jgi:hypothetical protein